MLAFYQLYRCNTWALRNHKLTNAFFLSHSSWYSVMNTHIHNWNLGHLSHTSLNHDLASASTLPTIPVFSGKSTIAIVWYGQTISALCVLSEMERDKCPFLAYKTGWCLMVITIWKNLKHQYVNRVLTRKHLYLCYFTLFQPSTCRFIWLF